MKSTATNNFWKLYHGLPESVRRQAQVAFRLFRDNPAHPSLSFERLRSHSEFWSARVTRNYRVVGRKLENTMIWFWIGSHGEFDKRFPA